MVRYLTQEKLENSKDKERYKIVSEELEEFKSIIKGHEKLLYEIGKLWKHANIKKLEKESK